MSRWFHGCLGLVLCTALSFGSVPRLRSSVPAQVDYSDVLQNLRELVPCFRSRLALAKVSPDKLYSDDFWKQETFVYAPLQLAETLLKTIRQRDERIYNILAFSVGARLRGERSHLFRESLKKHFFRSAHFIITYGGEISSIDNDVAEVLNDILTIDPRRDDERCRLQHLYLLEDIVRAGLARIDLGTELKQKLKLKEETIQYDICIMGVGLEAQELLTKINNNAKEYELDHHKRDIEDVIMSHDPIFHFVDACHLGTFTDKEGRILFDQALQKGLTHTVLWILAKKAYPTTVAVK